MQHAPLVRDGEPREQLPRDVERLLVRQIADAFQQRREIFPVDELHRQEVLSVHLGNVVDAADIGVRELTGDAHLREETLAPHGIR